MPWETDNQAYINRSRSVVYLNPDRWPRGESKEPEEEGGDNRRPPPTEDGGDDLPWAEQWHYVKEFTDFRFKYTEIGLDLHRGPCTYCLGPGRLRGKLYVLFFDARRGPHRKPNRGERGGPGSFYFPPEITGLTVQFGNQKIDVLNLPAEDTECMLAAHKLMDRGRVKVFYRNSTDKFVLIDADQLEQDIVIKARFESERRGSRLVLKQMERISVTILDLSIHMRGVVSWRGEHGRVRH